MPASEFIVLYFSYYLLLFADVQIELLFWLSVEIGKTTVKRTVLTVGTLRYIDKNAI